ncbi:MAG TPA: NUDIX hydrolase [Candidatus Dormibacteraeota bacterium]
MILEHDSIPPFEVIASRESAREGNLVLRRDRVRWPDGLEADYRMAEAPDGVFVVPYAENGSTVLVRQWRHTWQSTTWEVPAGTLEPGEEPLACAQRELREEAGLIADDWTSLGATRGTAVVTSRQHLFLARGLHRVQRTPEPYERDMILREVPFGTALDAALEGEIEHAGSISALVRSARALGIV